MDAAASSAPVRTASSRVRRSARTRISLPPACTACMPCSPSFRGRTRGAPAAASGCVHTHSSRDTCLYILRESDYQLLCYEALLDRHTLDILSWHCQPLNVVNKANGLESIFKYLWRDFVLLIATQKSSCGFKVGVV